MITLPNRSDDDQPIRRLRIVAAPTSAPPRKSKPKGIEFGHRSWHAVADDDALKAATDPAGGLNLPQRIREIARYRANGIGHAQFTRGELLRLLPVLDRATGEIKPSAKAEIGRAIRTAKRRGWIEEESNTRCLVVSRHDVQRGNGRTSCAVHFSPKGRQ